MECLLVHKPMNGACFVTGQCVIDLIELGFNDTSTLNCDDDVVNLYDSAGGTYISSAAVMDSRGDKREGQWRKENE